MLVSDASYISNEIHKALREKKILIFHLPLYGGSSFFLLSRIMSFANSTECFADVGCWRRESDRRADVEHFYGKLKDEEADDTEGVFFIDFPAVIDAIDWKSYWGFGNGFHWWRELLAIDFMTSKFQWSRNLIKYCRCTQNTTWCWRGFKHKQGEVVWLRNPNVKRSSGWLRKPPQKRQHIICLRSSAALNNRHHNQELKTRWMKNWIVDND